MVKRAPQAGKTALLVHSDLNVLSVLQSVLTQQGVRTVVARDLPTMLMAITQHYFDLAVVGSRISEEGDGWPVASVLRMVFPNAFIGVVAPRTDVLTLKAAINSGINEVYDSGRTPQEIASQVVAQMASGRRPKETGSSTVH
jgi:ActR/RegA family two-component response regulator